MMEDYKGVLVYAESAGTRLSSTTCELLECGRKLAADLGHTLSCVLPPEVSGALAAEATARGAQQVLIPAVPPQAGSSIEFHLAVGAAAVAACRRALLLVGHTPLGRELGPRLAFRLNVAAATDCVDVHVDPTTRSMVMTKPVYGGNALAEFSAAAAPQVATIRPKALSAAEPVPGRTSKSVSLKIDVPAARLRVVERVQQEVVGVKLEDATVVVSGGRGTAGPAPFAGVLKDLADALHGAVGASRPPCDNGWAPESMHIGLTGKIVAPDLYIAVAISGASQHMAGCSGSRTIVAVNKDAEANIFREATYGVVGRFEDVLPAFTAKIRQLLSD